MCDPLRPNARLVAAAAVCTVARIIGADVDNGAGSPVMLADFGATAAVTIVVGVVNFLSGLFRGRVDPNVKQALEGMRGGLVDLGKAIVEGLTMVAWQFARVWDWLVKWFGRIFRELYDVIRSLVERLVRILDRIIGPVIDFLEKVRDHVWAIYRDVVKPILDIIEFIRLPLRVLARFGVDWAKKLDETLAALEDEIVENFTFVMGKLNQAINFLNMVVDVNGLLKRFTLIRSITRDLNIVMSLWWNRSHIPLVGIPLERYRQPFERRAVAAAGDDARAYIEFRQGPDRGLIDEHWTDLRLRLERG